MDYNPEILLECAVAAAQQAVSHAVRNAGRRFEVASEHEHDIKLRLDRECQEIAESVILERFPDHAILGEESEIPHSTAPIEWIVDPIDGTVNYFHGVPWWCSSIAARMHGRLVAGAVCAPDVCYTAYTDGPALRNGEKIFVSDKKSLDKALILTGISRNPAAMDKSMAVFEKLCAATRKVRIMGAAALDLCNVASGKADGYYESDIYIWDVAAAGLIVERAGGRCLMVPAENNAGHRVRFVAANPHIFDSLRNTILC